MKILHFKKNKLNILIIILCTLCLFFFGFIATAELLVDNMFEKTYSDISNIPTKKTALLLGTSKYTSNGLKNLFYIYRIDAALDLYENKKITYVLVSGDNGTTEYNEPEQIKTDLIAGGIPEQNIYLDYAGFRTWDSVIRANKVFLENDFIIVSQKFHNERALYIAKSNSIEAIAFNAKDVPISISPRVWLRERFARVKTIIDALLNKKPKFLGDTIEIK